MGVINRRMAGGQVGRWAENHDVSLICLPVHLRIFFTCEGTLIVFAGRTARPNLKNYLA